MSSKFDLVVFLSNDWVHKHRSRYLLLSMAKVNANCMILCVQRPICFFTSPLLHPRKVLNWIRRKDRLSEVLPNLFVFQPIVFLHDHLAPHVPFASKANKELLSFQLLNKLQELDVRRDNLAVWISDPMQEECLGLVKERMSIYDCFDDYLAYAGSGLVRNAKQLERREKRILRKADVVFTVSEELYREKVQFNKSTYLVPNAVDAQLFGKASHPSTVIPFILERIGRPVVGFVGNLNERVDFDLIRHLAARHPEWPVVIVGGWRGARRDFIQSDLIRGLKRTPNVHWLGHQAPEELPGYLKGFDVCLIPYLDSDPFNMKCSPLKLFEYLATGKPIVSTNLPSVRGYSGVVRIGRTCEEFEREVILALEENRRLREKRKQLANDNSWDHRARKILSIIRKHEKQQGTGK